MDSVKNAVVSFYRNRKKKECLDGQSDFPETLKIPNEMEDLVIEGRNISTSKSILEDQV